MPWITQLAKHNIAQNRKSGMLVSTMSEARRLFLSLIVFLIKMLELKNMHIGAPE